MKKILLSTFALCLFTEFSMAGGDIAPVTSLVKTEEQVRESSYYIGLGLVYNRVYSRDSGWFDDSVLTQDETGGLTGIIGYNYNEYIGIEGRISGSLWERDYSDMSTWSIFLKPQYRFQENDRSSDAYDDGYFTVYGLIGFGNSYVEGYNGTIPAWPNVIGQEIMSETGFQWGLGLSYTFVDVEYGDRKNSWSIFIDYTMTADDVSITPTTLYSYDANLYDRLSTDGLTVGILYSF